MTAQFQEKPTSFKGKDSYFTHETYKGWDLIRLSLKYRSPNLHLSELPKEVHHPQTRNFPHPIVTLVTILLDVEVSA